ncbi:chorismate synthase [Denitrovibrio acetiphilus DSM 12809]|uniref:Chorismate synthase n=1 Tax=Denitrovibrio acetiphilus (strain DSM 12809 / NBRC 114555 / N2460) TaxID=522772 RepID=D4H0T2_DENA2|nr:chorismate synthase [Denitrovibrio acetiphilus]ADD68595.1 chorismate synthase [Denitrovibrio acetiphilus DSM 12809]
MAGSTFGTNFTITTFGESHGKAVGVVLDGCPPMIELSVEDVQKELDRRRPGQSKVSTPRDESDTVEIYSGIFEGKTTGTPIMMMVFNKNQMSRDYNAVKDLFRPGHADFTYYSKYGVRDHRGGGRSSARETIGRVCAGAVAKKILSRSGVTIQAYVIQVGPHKAEKRDLGIVEENIIRTCDLDAAKKMEEYIVEAKEAGDSVGAIVEVIVKGVPVGVGEPVFDRLNALISHAIMSIPAVKGIEFGKGFEAALMRGSEHNDEMIKYGFLSNNAGGTLGGMASGQDIIFRFVVKPASSITVPRKGIDLYGNEKTVITEGRHDPCVAPRVVPVAEAMTGVVLVDLIMSDKAIANYFEKK